MDKDEAILCKVVLIGETGVGKTQIVSKFVEGRFTSSLNPTIGAHYYKKTNYFKDFHKSIRFDIWDTAGQEKYRAIARVFYKDAFICILVYDITRRDTFEQLKSYWINAIKTNGLPNISITIFYKNIFFHSTGNSSK